MQIAERKVAVEKSENEERITGFKLALALKSHLCFAFATDGNEIADMQSLQRPPDTFQRPQL